MKYFHPATIENRRENKDLSPEDSGVRPGIKILLGMAGFIRYNYSYTE